MKYLNEQSIESTHVFGYSMGGYVALKAALSLPQKIKRIITLGTKFNWDEESTAREVKMMNPDKVEEKVPHFAAKLKEEHHPQDWKKVMDKTAQMMINMSKGAKLMDEDFKQINLPVVIGIGSLDKMVTYDESEKVASILPDAKLISLDGVKHPIDKVEPVILLKYIMENSK